MNANLKLIRSLLRELRAASSEGKIKDNIMVQYILRQAREHKETSETFCKAREELQHLAQTYNCYLSSLRAYHQIHVDYAGAGERTVRETADLVGFKLPHDPK
uniref:Protein FMC1 homolog n=1 Tax=Bracon brevicornis TaxID=1563983 RepID=A0A6V7HX70_9HYME